MDQDDIDAIKKAIEDLNQASHKLAEVMYAQAAAQQGAGPEGQQTQGSSAEGAQGAPGKDENVVDADFEEVDPEKK